MHIEKLVHFKSWILVALKLSFFPVIAWIFVALEFFRSKMSLILDSFETLRYLCDAVRVFRNSRVLSPTLSLNLVALKQLVRTDHFTFFSVPVQRCSNVYRRYNSFFFHSHLWLSLLAWREMFARKKPSCDLCLHSAAETSISLYSTLQKTNE